MGTPGKDRQAAFKAKMRETGKRQITVWADAQQEQALKNALEDCRQAPEDRVFSDEEIAALCVVSAWFGWDTVASLAKVDRQQIFRLLRSPEIKDIYEQTLRRRENDYEVSQRANELERREKEITAREVALAKRASETTSYDIAAKTNYSDRINRLVANFTTEDNNKGEQVKIDRGYTAQQRAKEMVNLSRQTALARTTISGLLQNYGKQGVLIEKEATILEDAARVLHQISGAAGEAKNRVKATATRVALAEEKREKEARAATKQIFPQISISDAILLLGHLNKYPILIPYEIKMLKTIVPGNKHDTDYYTKDAISSAAASVRRHIEDGIKAGKKAGEVAAELLASFNEAKPALTEKYGDYVSHAVTCLTAVRLMDT